MPHYNVHIANIANIPNTNSMFLSIFFGHFSNLNTFATEKWKIIWLVAVTMNMEQASDKYFPPNL